MVVFTGCFLIDVEIKENFDGKRTKVIGYLKLENISRIITLFVSSCVFFSLIQTFGFFKIAPDIEVVIKSPIRVLDYKKFQNEYKKITNKNIPEEVYDLVKKKQTNSIWDDRLVNLDVLSSVRSIYQNPGGNNILFEELTYGKRSKNLSDEVFPDRLTHKDFQKLTDGWRPSMDYLIDVYREELGIKRTGNNQIMYEKLYDLSPTQYLIPIDSIYFPEFLNKFTEMIESRKAGVLSGEKTDAIIKGMWGETEAFYMALSQSVNIFTIIIFKNTGNSFGENINIKAYFNNIGDFQIERPTLLSSYQSAFIPPEEIPLGNPKTVSILLDALKPEGFRCLLIKTTGNYPKKENFSIKIDKFEKPNKKMAMIAIGISFALTMFALVIDFYLLKKEKPFHRT